MIKAIAVDFGGVYFTWNYEKYARFVSSAIGVDYETTKKALSLRMRDFHVKKVTEKEYWDAFCREIGKEIDHATLRKVTFDRLFKPKESVISLMDELKSKYKIALVSNSTIYLDILDKKHGFYKNFDLLLNSHMVKVQKPCREIYELLIRKARAKPEEIVFIDDQERNLVPAREMGIKCILFKNVRQLKRELASFGVRA